MYTSLLPNYRLWLLAFASVLLGHLLSGLVVQVFGLRLFVNNLSQAVWFFLVSPVLETWVFNFLLQQGLYIYLSKKTEHKIVIHCCSLLVASSCFALVHFYAVGIDALYWFFPALILSALWSISQSMLVVTLVHACWNMSLVWFSS